MRALVLLLLAPALLLGCRDAIVDAPLDPGGAPVTEPDPAQFYVKGPAALTVGTEAVYRAEIVLGASSYHWQLAGSIDAVSGIVETLDGLNRLLHVTAVRHGAVTLVVQARDAEGRLMAVSHKDVRVRDA